MYNIDDLHTEELSDEQEKKHREILDLCLRISELEHTQYTEVIDEKLISQLKSDVYKIVKEAAFISHGKSEIDFDDTNGKCYITLYSKFLFLDAGIGISSADAAALLKSAIWTKITNSDDFVKIQFMFSTKKRVKTSDYASEIDKLKMQLKSYKNMK